MSRTRDGLLLIDKPQGLTSAGVVSRLRRYLGMKRVGHTGTLDPFATGLLPICTGRATGAAGYLLGWDKSYRAEILLGQATDTMDREGQITDQVPPAQLLPLFDIDRIRPLVSGLTSETRQEAPLYSAVKIQGKALYKYARQGQEVDRPVRDIRVYEASLIEIRDPGDGYPRLTVNFKVSSGTYIRSLADLLGRKLGVFAHVTALRRLSVGRLNLEGAVRLEELEEIFRLSGEEPNLFWQEVRDRGYVLPTGAIFRDWDRLDLTFPQALDLSYGRTLSCPHPDSSETAFLWQDRLVAIGSILGGTGRVRRVFLTAEDLEKEKKQA